MKNQEIIMPLNHMDELYNSQNKLVNFVLNDRLNDIIKTFLKLNIKNANILDAGCGEGHLLKKMEEIIENNFYYGIDVTPVAIKQCKHRCPFADIKVGNLVDTQYPNDKFDVIICTEVIEHMIKYQQALTEMKRILKPGGILIITFPNEILWTIGRFLLRRKPLKVPDHFNSFTPNRMIKAVNMELVNQKSLPFNLPFFISLGKLMVFKK